MKRKVIFCLILLLACLALVLCFIIPKFSGEQETENVESTTIERVETTTEGIEIETAENSRNNEIKELADKATGSANLAEVGASDFLCYKVLGTNAHYDEIAETSVSPQEHTIELSDKYKYFAAKLSSTENIYISFLENDYSKVDAIFLKRTMPTRSLSEFADFVVGETSRDEIKAFDTPVDEIVEAKGLPIATMHLTNDGYAVIIGYVEDYLRDNNKNLVVASIAYVPMKSTKENEELLLSCLSPTDKEAFEKNFEGGYYQFMQEFSIGGLYENSLYDYKNLKIFVCEPLVSYSYMNHAFASLCIYWTDTAADRGAYFEDFDEHITLGEVTNNFTK